MRQPNFKRPFIGRHEELKALHRLWELKIACLAVVSGRRRIGKSRLLEEFGRGFEYYGFTGLPPREGMTAQVQRKEFVRQFQDQFDFPNPRTDDWGDLFAVLAKLTQDRQVIIVFDELSWMASKDPDFLGKLKIAWDLYFKKNSRLILILCSSVSSWMEKNIMSSTGFLGRPTLHIRLNELPLDNCNQFWDKYGSQISAFAKLKMLSVTGGVPRYLELLDPKQTAEDNIKALCFNRHGPLFDEFAYIFADIYGRRSQLYYKIIRFLCKRKGTQREISHHLNIKQSSDLTEYLNELCLGGFIARNHTWNTKKKQISNLSYYRLSDNYTRFYLKYIEPNRDNINNNLFEIQSLSSLSGWASMLGLQFETLVINNHRALIKQIGIKGEDIICANPFFQRATTRQPGCQIDYMIQTRHDSIYPCEIKFTRDQIDRSIIMEMNNKLQRLKLPKHLSCRPVLIHVNGVKDEVVDEGYFYRVIDFGKLLSDE